MSIINRREFVTTAGSAVALSLLPRAAPTATQRARATLTLLFQGDSITDAGRNRSAAAPNQADALGLGYPLRVASTLLGQHPERELHCFNRGVSGNTVPDLEGLLERTTAALPAVRLVVLEPFVLRCGAVTDAWFPEFDARRAAAQRVAARAGASFLALQGMFDRLSRRAPPAYWAADGVHPTVAGHGAIAELWLKTVNV